MSLKQRRIYQLVMKVARHKVSVTEFSKLVGAEEAGKLEIGPKVHFNEVPNLDTYVSEQIKGGSELAPVENRYDNVKNGIGSLLSYFIDILLLKFRGILNDCFKSLG